MMKSLYGKAASDMLKLASDLNQAVEDSDDVAFVILLNATLQFAKKGDEGTQIVLAKAEDGVPGLQKALTIVKSVDAEITHPYKQNQATKLINKLLAENYSKDALKKFLASVKNSEPVFNTNCFQSVVHKQKWEQSISSSSYNK